MTLVRRILKDYQDSGALNAVVNVHAAIDEQTFLTKAGDLMTVLAVDGVDYECLDASELDRIARRFESALRVLDEHFRLYQYLLKRDHAPIPARGYDAPIVREAVASRAAYLKSKSEALYSLEIYFVVVYEGWRPPAGVRHGLAQLLKAPRRTLRESLSAQQAAAVLDAGLDQARERLSHKVMSLLVQLPEAVRGRVLGKQQAFQFLRRLLNYAPHKADGVRLAYDSFVDFQACDSALECHRDHLRLDDFYVQVLTLKEPPAQTFANLLRGVLEIPCNLVLCSEWKREDHATMRRRIQSMRRHFHNAKSSLVNYLGSSSQTQPKDMLVDDSAVAVVRELGACLEDLELNGRAFGEFSMTAVLFDRDRAKVARAVADCFKGFATHDARLIEERYNLLNAWLAVLPGNGAYNLRRLWLLDTNYADLSFLYTLHPGEPVNTHLGAEYLAVLETNHRTPYFFNLHYQDVAHAIVLGATGSGKSFLLNFLLTQLQKYAPYTFIFDLGGSYQNLTQIFHGSYLPIGAQTRPLINPFRLPPNPDNLRFLAAFIRVLIESSGYRLTTEDERDVCAQIENVYVVDPDQRRLFTLSNMLSRPLRLALEKWVEGGPLGSLFDHAEDTLTFSRFQAFDFEGMEKSPEALEALLFYVLHRANAAIYDTELGTTLKVFVIDEAWRFLRHPTIKQYILEGLKTWRKKNAAMILATQSSDDLLRSEMLSVVVESCATKIFLANPDLDPKLYREIFHLNDAETAWIARLIPKQQMLVKRPDRAKVLNLHVSDKDYWLYTNNPTNENSDATRSSATASRPVWTRSALPLSRKEYIIHEP